LPGTSCDIDAQAFIVSHLWGLVASREKQDVWIHGSEDPLGEIGLHRVQMASNEKLSCSHQRANQARELLTGKQ
jgi:hypothetical protein